MNILKIYALGSFYIENGKQIMQESDWDSLISLKLFKYLLVHIGETIVHEKIVGELWPDSDLTTGVKRLYNTIYKLRSMFNDNSSELIITTPIGYSLNRQILILDWQVFTKIYYDFKRKYNNGLPKEENQEIINLLKRAVNLYRGDFMPNDKYEDWTREFREEYREMYLEIIKVLANNLYCSGNKLEALHYLKKGIREEPYREDFYFMVIKILKEEGRIAEAVSLYNKYEKIIKDELDVFPSEQLQEMLFRVYDSNREKKMEIARERGYKGALICNTEVFKIIYNFEERKAVQTKKTSTLLTISIEKLPIVVIKKIARSIGKKLREVDVITFDQNSIKILLFKTKPADFENILFTIKQDINQYIKPGNNIEIKWKEIKTPH